MKILVIEDDANKNAQMVALVRAMYPEASIAERRSFQSGLREALSAAPDVILLDMTMPTYDVSETEPGGRTRPFGGRDVLSQLARRRLGSKVIVVTQFESFVEDEKATTFGELTAALKREFPANFCDAVFYRPSESEWRRRLSEALGRVWPTTHG